MEKEKFTSIVWENVEKCPKCWRKGQAVFNVIDEIFGVARSVQLVDGIDCFYNDDLIDKFIDKSFEQYSKL